MRAICLAIALVLLAFALPASPAHAAGVVTVCGEKHLQEALIGGGAVTFRCSGTIKLSGTLTIAANTSIDGTGQNVTISGNGVVQVITVKPQITLILKGLTIVSGQGPIAGAIFNDAGILNVSDSSFYGNSAPQGGAGAIRNSHGTVNLSHSVFSGNAAPDGAGAVFNDDGMVTVTGSTFSGNHVTSSTGPGAIYNNDNATLVVSNSIFSGNSDRDGHGGAILSDGNLTVTNSTFTGNGTPSGNGGGIANNGNMTVSNSAFSDNRAAYGGGGIYNSGALTVSNSTFSENRSSYFGGGIGNVGKMSVTNSTFSGNSAVLGGGIFSPSDCSSCGPVTLTNTIVANSPTGGNCTGAISDGGGNLSYPDTTCPGINGDPKLFRFRYYGGPTPTMALNPGSAALDAADDALCAASPVNNLDQRGYPRPVGPHCDIGAYEGVLVLNHHDFLPMIK